MTLLQLQQLYNAIMAGAVLGNENEILDQINLKQQVEWGRCRTPFSRA